VCSYTYFPCSSTLNTGILVVTSVFASFSFPTFVVTPVMNFLNAKSNCLFCNFIVIVFEVKLQVTYPSEDSFSGFTSSVPTNNLVFPSIYSISITSFLSYNR